MKILGIDPSMKRTGFAVVVDGAVKAQYHLSPKGDTGQQMYRLKAFTVDLCKQHGIGYVAIEKPVARFMHGARPTFHAEGACLLGAYEAQVTAISYSPPEWRKVVLGQGNARKVDAIEFAKKKTPRVENEDCAEAICIALALEKELKEAK